jgi:hypothetical protein
MSYFQNVDISGFAVLVKSFILQKRNEPEFPMPQAFVSTDRIRSLFTEAMNSWRK